MLFNKTALPENRSGFDPVYFYISVVALSVFMYISFGNYVTYLYEQLLAIPCALCLGNVLSRKITPTTKKYLCLSIFMVFWFTFLQVKRTFENGNIYSFGLFFSTYLFAFPLASLTQDGAQKKYLKLLASAFIVATLVLSGYGILLLLDIHPAFLVKYVYWDGARFCAFWHPNILACLLMIGFAFCSMFLFNANSRWSKAALCALLLLLLGMIALTNCRTVILLIGVYLGGHVFFTAVKQGRKWILPGLVAAVVLAIVVFTGSGKLYQLNHDALLEKYTAQYQDQLLPDETSIPQDNSDSTNHTEPDQTDAEAAAGTAVEEESAISTEVVSDEAYIDEVYDSTEYTAEEYYEEEYEEHYEEEYYEEEYYEEEEPEETLPVYVDPNTGEFALSAGSAQNSFWNDLSTLNSRSYIWTAARFAIREAPSILLWGVDKPGHYVSYYNFFYSAHTHNAWIECLMGLGLPGLLMAILFTLFAVWNSLIILLKHYQDTWKRGVALLTLCLLVSSIMEPYLFYTTSSYHLIDFMFFLCVGYMVHWQEEDNRNILSAVRKFLHMK